MMRFCPKCGELYADVLLAFCLADGAPLGAVSPDSDVWKEGQQAFNRKTKALRRRLRWRRVILTTMLAGTLILTASTINRSISVIVDRPQGKLCLASFNDLNGNLLQDTGELALPGFVFQLSAPGFDKTLTTLPDGTVCADLPVGAYTVAEQSQNGWVATSPAIQNISITAGQPATLRFGNRQDKPEVGRLCIAAFNDLNANRLQEPNEAGISGCVFQLSAAAGATTLETGPNGIVCADLPAGTYTVIEQPRSGWTPVTTPTQTVTVTPNQPARLSYGSKQEPGKLCITTFNDQNANGAQDAGESGLAGFLFQVRRAGFATTLTTGADGGICADLQPGTYTLVEQPRNGWTTTTPATKTVAVGAGQVADVSFGSLQQKGKLCIAAFNDLNSNRSQDSNEAGISAFVFQVSGMGTTTTLTAGADGTICSQLIAGTYTVTAKPQKGWLATTPTTLTINLTADPAANVSFGSKRETSTLCVTTFNDSNSNGVKDKTEAGLPEFVVEVSGTGISTTISPSPNGVGCIPLPVGAYTVVEQPRKGWIPTTLTTQPVNIIAGQTANRFFGYKHESPHENARLCIKTFDDRNANGKPDREEPGLEGFGFEVSGAGARTTLTSDSQGIACAELPPGNYTVIQELQKGWIPTTPTKQRIKIDAGQTGPLYFGSRREPIIEKTKLCITAFEDLNGNHQQDRGEQGLSGFAFHVSGQGINTTLPAGPNGEVCAEFPVGTYRVMEIPKPGWRASQSTIQSIRLIASNEGDLYFGNMRAKADCSDADKNQEQQAILKRYQATWHESIESERPKIIAKHAPRVPNGKVSLRELPYRFLFRSCTAVNVTVQYEWVIGNADVKETVPGTRTYSCEKGSADWVCH